MTPREIAQFKGEFKDLEDLQWQLQQMTWQLKHIKHTQDKTSQEAGGPESSETTSNFSSPASIAYSCP